MGKRKQTTRGGEITNSTCKEAEIRKLARNVRRTIEIS